MTPIDTTFNQSYGKANFKMERFGNLEGDCIANYSIFGGALDGHIGQLTIPDGVSELEFSVDLPSSPLEGSDSKIRLDINDVDGFSCPKLIGTGVEFEMVHDVQPTSIVIIKPESAKQSDGSLNLTIVREGNMGDCVTIPYTIKSSVPGSQPISGVVFFDANSEQNEQNVKIDFNMAPCDAIG